MIAMSAGIKRHGNAFARPRGHGHETGDGDLVHRNIRIGTAFVHFLHVVIFSRHPLAFSVRRHRVPCMNGNDHDNARHDVNSGRLWPNNPSDAYRRERWRIEEEEQRRRREQEERNRRR